MSWSLNAAGHVPAQDPSAGAAADAGAVEMELYEALKTVLADPRYGTATSIFSGSHVSGSLHAPDA